MSQDLNRDRLKSMSQGNRNHPFRNLKRILKYGIIGFCRNIWLSLTASLVMTITLTLLFLTLAASTVLSTTADAMREKITTLRALKSLLVKKSSRNSSMKTKTTKQLSILFPMRI